MFVNRFLLVALLMSCLALLLDPPAAQAVETNKRPDPQIIERIIKIEGTIERPRVLFILPRARIWRDDPLRKSFFDDILKPVYPEALLKDFTKYELNKHIIRRR